MSLGIGGLSLVSSGQTLFLGTALINYNHLLEKRSEYANSFSYPKPESLGCLIKFNTLPFLTSSHIRTGGYFI